MKRPTGVTILASVLFVFAGLLALSALGIALPDFDPGDLPPEFQDLNIQPELFTKIMAVVFVIFAVILAAIGTGLLLLKNWVRIATIVFGGIEIFFSAIQVLVLAATAQDALLLFGLIKLAAISFAVWYLLQPSVKAAFKPAPAGPQASPQIQPDNPPPSPTPPQSADLPNDPPAPPSDDPPETS